MGPFVGVPAEHFQALEEIDNRIATIEFQLCTESVPLKEDCLGAGSSLASILGISVSSSCYALSDVVTMLCLHFAPAAGII